MKTLAIHRLIFSPIFGVESKNDAKNNGIISEKSVENNNKSLLWLLKYKCPL